MMPMNVTPEEQQKYQQFVRDCIREFKTLDFDPETILWHYTSGKVSSAFWSRARFTPLKWHA